MKYFTLNKSSIMPIRLFSVMFFVFLVSMTAFAQTREELQKKEQDLQKELAELNKQYTETQKNKKVSLKQLAIIKNKINKRQELINGINRQVRQLDETIYLNERDIYRLRRELDTLKVKYAQSIVFAYKNRGSYEYLNFLFSASSFNDAIKRVTYLKSYRQNRETQANTIIKSDQLLQQKIGVLSSNKKDRLATLQTQSDQLKVLQVDRNEQDQVVKQLQGKEKEISAQINDREKQRQKVRQAYNAVIRREIDEANKREAARLKALEDQRKKQPDATAKTSTPASSATTPKSGTGNNEPITGVVGISRSRDYSPLESTPEGREMSINFENNKGKLPWPVSTGVVTGHLGTEKIQGTKLKRTLDGIEISLPIGSTVKSVADGVVVSVSADDNAFVVIRHGKYFCGYSNLSSVNVSRNQEVKAGTTIGKSGTSIDGEGILMFSIMNDKAVQMNPESWLKPQR
jgi:septal ring factor EnvC (AmiA/AmiB activator)